jgi:hypothetical protein
MNAFRKWLWSAPHHGLAHWLLLIMAFPLAIVYVLMSFSDSRTIYTIPAACVWSAMVVMQLMEVLPRRWIVGAAIGRSVALILGWGAGLWLLWMIAPIR